MASERGAGTASGEGAIGVNGGGGAAAAAASLSDEHHDQLNELPEDARASRTTTRSTTATATAQGATPQRERSQSRGRMASMLHKIQEGFNNRPSSRDRQSHKDHHDHTRSALSHTTTNDTEGGSTLGGDERRGRDARSVKDGEYMVSTGRGGAGNIRASSRAREAEAAESGELNARENSRERSRERGALGGRGGAGNWRAASKDPVKRAQDTEAERQAQAAEKAAHEKRMAEEVGHFHSTGRGGAGNIK